MKLILNVFLTKCQFEWQSQALVTATSQSLK